MNEPLKEEIDRFGVWEILALVSYTLRERTLGETGTLYIDSNITQS